MLKKLLILFLCFILTACAANTSNGQTSPGKEESNQTESTSGCPEEEPGCIAADDTSGEHQFNEISFDDAIVFFTEKKSGVLYFAFTACPWCQDALPVLTRAIEETGVNVNYIKTRDDTEDHNRLYTDEQKELIQPYIEKYMSENDEGIMTLYVPLVLIVKDGVVIDGHVGTFDEHDATERDLTTDEELELEKIYTEMLEKAK
ncbi:MAG: thioredoxin family protein [Faecalicoccus sp.]|nr:thioredoxin family protein [Faecalicoccus sp.]